jgi:hypothetical protein
MLNLLLAISVAVLVIGIFLVARRAASVWNPFSLILGLFVMEIAIFLAIPFNTRPVPGADPSIDLGIIFLGASVSIVFGIALGLRPKVIPGQASRTRIGGLGPLTLLFSALALLTLVDLIRQSGGIPLLLIAEGFALGVGANYSDYYTSTFMYGLGLCRIPAVALAVDYIQSKESFDRHFRANVHWYGITLGTSALMMLGGQRNCFVWPFAVWGAAYLLCENPSGKRIAKVAALVLLLGMVFVLVGNLRLGSGQQGGSPLFAHVDVDLPDNLITRSLIWLPVYMGPTLYNLNAALSSGYEPTMGATLLTRLLPDSWVPDGLISDRSILDHLQTENLMPMFGQTFRTAMTDFYGEFGTAGAIVIPGIIVFFMAHGFSKAKGSVFWCSIYCGLLPGLLMLPFHDYFTGAQNVISIVGSVLILILAKKQLVPMARLSEPIRQNVA